MTCALVSAIHDGRHPGARVEVLAPGTVIAKPDDGARDVERMPPGRMRKAPLPRRGLIASGARPAAQKASSPFATIAVLLDAPEMTAQIIVPPLLRAGLCALAGTAPETAGAGR